MKMFNKEPSTKTLIVCVSSNSYVSSNLQSMPVHRMPCKTVRTLLEVILKIHGTNFGLSPACLWKPRNLENCFTVLK